MLRDRLFRVGLVGSILSALCCFTPILMVGLGLSAVMVDLLVLPVLILFLCVMLFAAIRRLRS